MSVRSIAVEGLCFAGKSTLARSLLKENPSTRILLQDYSDFANSNERPKVPALSVEEELAAMRFYLEIDQLRWTKVSQSPVAPETVVQDRCFHTLLAHTFANGQIQGFSAMDKAAELVLGSRKIHQPDLVLFLDASDETLQHRYDYYDNNLPSLFKSKNYASAFREYFTHHYIGNKENLIMIDANRNIKNVLRLALEAIREAWPC